MISVSPYQSGVLEFNYEPYQPNLDLEMKVLLYKQDKFDKAYQGIQKLRKQALNIQFANKEKQLVIDDFNNRISKQLAELDTGNFDLSDVSVVNKYTSLFKELSSNTQLISDYRADSKVRDIAREVEKMRTSKDPKKAGYSYQHYKNYERRYNEYANSKGVPLSDIASKVRYTKAIDVNARLQGDITKNVPTETFKESVEINPGVMAEVVSVGKSKSRIGNLTMDFFSGEGSGQALEAAEYKFYESLKTDPNFANTVKTQYVDNLNQRVKTMDSEINNLTTKLSKETDEHKKITYQANLERLQKSRASYAESLGNAISNQSVSNEEAIGYMAQMGIQSSVQHYSDTYGGYAVSTTYKPNPMGEFSLKTQKFRHTLEAYWRDKGILLGDDGSLTPIPIENLSPLEQAEYYKNLAAAEKDKDSASGGSGSSSSSSSSSGGVGNTYTSIVSHDFNTAGAEDVEKTSYADNVIEGLNRFAEDSYAQTSDVLNGNLEGHYRISRAQEEELKSGLLKMMGKEGIAAFLNNAYSFNETERHYEKRKTEPIKAINIKAYEEFRKLKASAENLSVYELRDKIISINSSLKYKAKELDDFVDSAVRYVDEKAGNLSYNEFFGYELKKDGTVVGLDPTTDSDSTVKAQEKTQAALFFNPNWSTIKKDLYIDKNPFVLEFEKLVSNYEMTGKSKEDLKEDHAQIKAFLKQAKSNVENGLSDYSKNYGDLKRTQQILGLMGIDESTPEEVVNEILNTNFKTPIFSGHKMSFSEEPAGTKEKNQFKADHTKATSILNSSFSGANIENKDLHNIIRYPNGMVVVEVSETALLNMTNKDYYPNPTSENSIIFDAKNEKLYDKISYDKDKKGNPIYRYKVAFYDKYFVDTKWSNFLGLMLPVDTVIPFRDKAHKIGRAFNYRKNSDGSHTVSLITGISKDNLKGNLFQYDKPLGGKTSSISIPKSIHYDDVIRLLDCWTERDDCPGAVELGINIK